MAFDINKLKNTIDEAKAHKVKLEERSNKIKASYRRGLNKSYNDFISSLNSDDFEDFLQELLDDKYNYDCDLQCFIITAKLYYKRTNFRLKINSDSYIKEKEYLITTNIDWHSSYINYEKDKYFKDLFQNTMQEIYKELISKLKSLGFAVKIRCHWDTFDLWDDAARYITRYEDSPYTTSTIELKINN